MLPPALTLLQYTWEIGGCTTFYWEMSTCSSCQTTHVYGCSGKYSPTSIDLEGKICTSTPSVQPTGVRHLPEVPASTPIVASPNNLGLRISPPKASKAPCISPCQTSIVACISQPCLPLSNSLQPTTYSISTPRTYTADRHWSVYSKAHAKLTCTSPLPKKPPPPKNAWNSVGIKYIG